MGERIFERDPATRSTQHFSYDVTTGKITIRDEQVVDLILDANKTLRNSDEHHSRKSEMRRVASIPMNIYMELRKAGILSDPVAFKRWLNDPDNRAFRTDTTHV